MQLSFAPGGIDYLAKAKTARAEWRGRVSNGRNFLK